MYEVAAKFSCASALMLGGNLRRGEETVLVRATLPTVAFFPLEEFDVGSTLRLKLP